MSEEKKKVLAQYYALRIKKGKLTVEEVMAKYPEIKSNLEVALTEIM